MSDIQTPATPPDSLPKPAAKTPARKAAGKTATQAAAKKAAAPAVQAKAKPVAKKAAVQRPVPVPAQKTAATPSKAPAPKPAAKSLVKKAKQKLIRDSFTMPSSDFALIDQLKTRAIGFKRPVKKSELLRAGLQALASLSDAKLKSLLDGLTPLKPGRPPNAIE